MKINIINYYLFSEKSCLKFKKLAMKKNSPRRGENFERLIKREQNYSPYPALQNLHQAFETTRRSVQCI